MISGIHTKQHHHQKTSMAGKKVPRNAACNWQHVHTNRGIQHFIDKGSGSNVSKGKTKAIVYEPDYQEVTSQTMVLADKLKRKGKVVAIANPVGSFEDPKVNFCTDMILHGDKGIVEDQNKRESSVSLMKIFEYACHDEEKARGNRGIMPPSPMIIAHTASVCNDQCISFQCIGAMDSASTDVYVLA
ncbi:hypothetical protein V6N13_058613 [Hibiscus sabdariffa]|uniref:Uncharacterized protein n=1 Tax=Hibiscus sabdariffa TaxID=183260 RepID=A0ABR2GFJ8_9ROSI